MRFEIVSKCGKLSGLIFYTKGFSQAGARTGIGGVPY